MSTLILAMFIAIAAMFATVIVGLGRGAKRSRPTPPAPDAGGHVHITGGGS